MIYTNLVLSCITYFEDFVILQSYVVYEICVRCNKIVNICIWRIHEKIEFRDEKESYWVPAVSSFQKFIFLCLSAVVACLILILDLSRERVNPGDHSIKTIYLLC